PALREGTRQGRPGAAATLRPEEAIPGPGPRSPRGRTTAAGGEAGASGTAIRAWRTPWPPGLVRPGEGLTRTNQQNPGLAWTGSRSAGGGPCRQESPPARHLVHAV